MIRKHLNEFLEDPEINLYDFKLCEMKEGTLTISILGHFKFTIVCLTEKSFDVNTKEEYLSDWVQTMKEVIPKKTFNHIGDLLELCIDVYTELPEDDSPLISPLTPAISPGQMFGISDDMDDVDDDYFENVCDAETLKKQEQHRQVLLEDHQKKMEKTKANLQFSSVYEKCSKHEIKLAKSQLSQSDVKDLYVVFFTDGFCVGTSEDEALKDTKRSLESPLIKNMQQGFVPKEFAGNFKEVDVHFIRKEYKYEERYEKLKTTRKGQNEVHNQDIPQWVLDDMQKIEAEKKLEKSKIETKFTLKDLQKLTGFKPKKVLVEDDDEIPAKKNETNTKNDEPLKFTFDFEMVKKIKRQHRTGKTCSIQLRFIQNNTRIINEMSESDKVAEILSFVRSVVVVEKTKDGNVREIKGFDLVFGNKKIDDTQMTKTIKESNLANSTIFVKIY